MLLLELEGRLFQLEHREPELEVSFQLPPKITAFLPHLTFLGFLIQAFIIPPTSDKCTKHTSC